MPRFASRHLFNDAALALMLLAVTVGPGLVTGLVSGQKPGDTSSLLTRSGLPADQFWWVCSGLALAGVVVRRQTAAVALVLTGAGTLGHLLLQTKFQLLDLALPLVMYTLATVVPRRRIALGALALTMVLTYLAVLGSRLDLVPNQQATTAQQAAEDRAERAVGVDGVQANESADGTQPTTSNKTNLLVFTRFPTEALVDTAPIVLEMWLLLVAAYAVGDGMRSRRAHLAAVEQRTADLAQQERQRAALAVAAERARISRELHDVVAHGMSVMVVQAQGAAAALERHPDRTATALRHVIEVGRSSLAEMRLLLAAGHAGSTESASLTPLPGIGAVPGLVDQLRRAGMRIDLRIEGVPDVVPAAVDLSAYRIVQEALTNTLKHAGQQAHAWVTLEYDPTFLRVEVTDDGQGLAKGADGCGNGLRGIAERAAMLGGTLETGAAPDRGYRLAATLPIEAPR